MLLATLSISLDLQFLVSRYLCTYSMDSRVWFSDQELSTLRSPTSENVELLNL